MYWSTPIKSTSEERDLPQRFTHTWVGGEISLESSVVDVIVTYFTLGNHSPSGGVTYACHCLVCYLMGGTLPLET